MKKIAPWEWVERYVAEESDEGIGDAGKLYVVADRNGALLYDDPMTLDEAQSLAWAWNSGAETDDEAVDMILERCRRAGDPIPSWLPPNMFGEHRS